VVAALKAKILIFCGDAIDAAEIAEMITISDAVFCAAIVLDAETETLLLQ